MAIGQSVLGFATTLSPLDSRHTGLHQQVKHPTIESVFNFHNIRSILFSEVIKHQDQAEDILAPTFSPSFGENYE